MPFCVETYKKNKWKVIRETVTPKKETADKLCESMLESCSTEEDRFLVVTRKYRVRRLRQKEADFLLKKKVVEEVVNELQGL